MCLENPVRDTLEFKIRRGFTDSIVAKHFIETLKEKRKRAEHLRTLTNEDWVMVSIYHKVMSPVALDRLQGEKDCSQGYILPTLFSMRHRLQILDGGNILRTCRDTMLKVVIRRFEMFFKVNEINRELVLAS